MKYNPYLTIHLLVYNEEVILPNIIAFWRSRFKDCKIIIYDNESTDNSKIIALKAGCSVITFKTDNLFNDVFNRNLKNTCYKRAETPFVYVADCDEVVDITQEDLKKELKRGASLIKTQGYDMIGNSLNINEIDKGVKNDRYSKFVLFNKDLIKDINYSFGAHEIYPQGTIKYSKTVYNLLHFKYLTEDYYINRTKIYADRFESWNKSVGHGKEYFISEEQMKEHFNNLLTKAIKII